MIPKNRISTHPGTILLKEYLEPMGLTQKELADHLDIPIQRVNEIVRGKRGISHTITILSFFATCAQA